MHRSRLLADLGTLLAVLIVLARAVLGGLLDELCERARTGHAAGGR